MQKIHKTFLSSEKIEVSLVQKVDGKVQYQIMKAADVDRYCAKAEAAKVCIQYAAYFTLIEFIFNFFLEKES